MLRCLSRTQSPKPAQATGSTHRAGRRSGCSAHSRFGMRPGTTGYPATWPPLLHAAMPSAVTFHARETVAHRSRTLSKLAIALARPCPSSHATIVTKREQAISDWTSLGWKLEGSARQDCGTNHPDWQPRSRPSPLGLLCSASDW